LYPVPFQPATAATVLARRSEVARLVARGWTQQQLADYFKVSQQMIAKDWKVIRRRWARIEHEEFTAHKQKLLLEINEVRQSAWRGWEKSLESATKKHTKKIVEGQTVKSLTPIRLEQDDSEAVQTGDASFLMVILKCNKREAELLAVDAPRKIAEATTEGDPLPRVRIVNVIHPSLNGEPHDGNGDG
jgi:hypothetical protein